MMPSGSADTHRAKVVITRLFKKSGSIARQLCPKCEQGKMFTGLFGMRPECEVCHLKFEREEGYWTGAMLINWVLVWCVLCPIWVVMFIKRIPFPAILLATVVLLIVLLPLFFRYSRAIWLYLDHTVDEERK